MAKSRLDHILVTYHHIESLALAQSLIMTGKVIVKNEKITKPGTLFKEEIPIRILGQPLDYVSRAAEKLRGVHQPFGLVFYP